MNKKQPFKISAQLIWLSSLFLGVIVALPTLIQHEYNIYEVIANSTITFVFSLFVWYYNMLTLPVYSNHEVARGFSVYPLLKNLLVGILVMFLLSYIQQLILTHINFGPVMLMFEVRGVLINLTFYMFIHMIYQSYQNQRVSIELERSKMDNLAAQYELLRQQVNPHFLFNTLNTLKYMVESNDEHSVDFILKLSDFYRFTLENRKLDLIRVEEELKILDAYVFLLKARFEEGFEVNVQIEKPTQQTMMPPFTLQLLVENAIKHNIVAPNKTLHVNIYKEGAHIVISNNVQPKITPEASTGIGLENINERYHHLLGKNIDIQPSTTTFTVKLPLINEDSHY
ncbi:histidine kinase [Chitinophaga skermanii]|uniref:Histidine kinase n=1 Tax=Chitinophaga skermanii TaxID=331697 RepID=A0A327Q1I2_9BACT|nr:histidine kinase [Chitinophaga skermanii]RAI97581.1 histidine kinase [Chitinophaga skermanii]